MYGAVCKWFNHGGCYKKHCNHLHFRNGYEKHIMNKKKDNSSWFKHICLANAMGKKCDTPCTYLHVTADVRYSKSRYPTKKYRDIVYENRDLKRKLRNLRIEYDKIDERPRKKRKKDHTHSNMDVDMTDIISKINDIEKKNKTIFDTVSELETYISYISS